MYKVILINNNEETVVHVPDTDKSLPHLLKINLNQKKSAPDKLTFIIPIQNEGYNKIYDLVTLVKVIDARDNSIEFEGRVITSPQKMDNTGVFTKEVTCEGELAYLNDTKTRSWDISGLNVNKMLDLLIKNHNGHTTADKQFTIGRVDVTGIIDIESNTNFESTLNCLLDKLVNKFSGVLKVRKEYGIRYLDYTGLVGQESTTVIQLGKNIKDMILEYDVTNIATRVIPVGKDNLTIEPVNNGKDYLEDAKAIKQYGIVEQIADLKGIEDLTLLKKSGQEYLDNAKKAKIKLQISALDLSVLDINIDSFEVGNDYKIINPVFNLNEYFTVIEKDSDLLEPWNSRIIIDNKFSTMTDRQINMQRAANALDAVLTANKKLNTYFLQGIIDTLKNQLIASGAYQKAEVIEGKGILLENTDASSPDYGALYLGPGIFSIANSKIGNAWNWRTFGTGKGFVADLIVTGILDGSLIKTGRIEAKNGRTVLDLDTGEFFLKNNTNETFLSANGILTTDTVQVGDNVDSSHPLTMKVYIDDEVISVRRAILNITLEKFRAYEKGIAGGGSYSTTSSSGGGYTGTSKSSAVFGWLSATTKPGYGSGWHTHDFKIDGLNLIHSHDISITAHSHGVSIPSHTHSIQYGIFESTVASNVSVIVDGKAVNSGINSNTSLNITNYINKKGWHTIQLTSSQLGRINASLYTKSYVGA